MAVGRATALIGTTVGGGAQARDPGGVMVLGQEGLQTGLVGASGMVLGLGLDRALDMDMGQAAGELMEADMVLGQVLVVPEVAVVVEGAVRVDLATGRHRLIRMGTTMAEETNMMILTM